MTTMFAMTAQDDETRATLEWICRALSAVTQSEGFDGWPHGDFLRAFGAVIDMGVAIDAGGLIDAVAGVWFGAGDSALISVDGTLCRIVLNDDGYVPMSERELNAWLAAAEHTGASR